MNQQRLVDTFLELIQIDSETGHEREISDHLKALFEHMGHEVIEDNSQAETNFGSGNLVINIKGSTEQTPIYFSCHMDTVTPGKNIRPEIREGVIYSDGTTILGADDKAGIAVMIEALRTLQEDNIAHGNLQFVISVGEESHLIGAKAFQKELLTSEYGYALDSGNTVGTIVTAAPSQATLDVEITGKTAHAGIAPEKGISAITLAAKSISRMTLGRIDYETTANIGRFEGGSATNIVADSCHILAEARSIDMDKLETQIEHMKTTFENTAKEFGGSANVTVTRSYPSFNIPEDHPVILNAARAAEKIGAQPEFIHSGGGSDANIFNGYGIPTPVLAVGYKEIHTTKEHMPINQMEQLTAMVLEIIQSAE